MHTLCLLLLWAGAAHAFQSTNLYTRPVIYNGLPSTQITASFTASNLDSTGTITLDSGCQATITVAPPAVNFIAQIIGRIPRDTISVEEVSCSVLSLDAYRANLEATGETLDLVMTNNGDNMTVVPGNAMRRRLLQIQTDEPPGDRVRSFAAVSNNQLDQTRESLNILDARLYSMVATYTPVSYSDHPSTFQLGSSSSNAAANAQQRQVEVDRKLILRAQNTDLAVKYLTDFVVAGYTQQQTNISQLFAMQNETNLAVIYLYNALIESIQNSADITVATAQAIQGLLDYREADRSIWQGWVDNNELRNLGSALYWSDVGQLPAGYSPFARHPGVAPNASLLTGPGARVRIDSVTVNLVERIHSAYPQTYGSTAAIVQNNYTTYMSSEAALWFSSNSMDSRFFLSLFGPRGCTPPYLDSTKSYFDITQWYDVVISPNNIQGSTNQTFDPSAPSCELWVEADVCSCNWYNGQGLEQVAFRWANNPQFASGGNPSLASICSNTANTAGYSATVRCGSMIVTSIAQLTSLLNINMCGQQFYMDTSTLTRYYLSSIGNAAIDQVDLTYMQSSRLQLRANTSTYECSYRGIIDSTLGLPTTFTGSFGTATPTDIYLSFIVAGFLASEPDIAAVRMAKYGRLAGVDTEVVSTNQYMQTTFKSDGSVDYSDASSEPLRCQKSTWNAYSPDLLPVYSFRVNGAQVVTNNIQVNVSCPVCNDCYNPTATLTQRVLNYDTGSFLLDGSFIAVGNLTALGNGGYVYDVPADKASVSPIIESRAYSPSYILLPSSATAMPSWKDWLALNPRNQRYSAALGGVSAMAYKQATVLAPDGRVVCASNETAAIPGAHLCVLLNNYALNYSEATGLATFSPVHWQVSFDLTINSGLFYDTVDTSNTCPIVTLQPTSSGSLTLVLQNDQALQNQLEVSYRPINNSLGMSCPGVCCQTQVPVVVPPRYTSFLEIPQCGWVNLTITVSSVDNTNSPITCFSASGQSLYAQLVTASTALDVDFFNPVNFTVQYENMLSNYYVQQAYEKMIAFQEAQLDYSERSQALIGQLRARRDYFEQQISNIQLQIGFTPTLLLDTTQLQDTISGLFAGNAAYDKEILTVDLPYIQQEAERSRRNSPGEDVLDFLNGLGKGATRAADWAKDKTNDFFDRISNAFGTDGECPEGFFSAILNSFQPGKPGLWDYVSCFADDLLTSAITIGCIIALLCCLFYCGGPILGWMAHKLMERGEQHRKRFNRNKQAKTGKEKDRKPTYSEVETDDEEIDVNTDEYDSDSPQRQQRKQKKRSSFTCCRRR